MFKKKRYIIGGLILVIVLGYLGFTAFQNSSTYYYTVDELLTDSELSAEQNVRVQGTVETGSVQENDSTREVQFVLTHNNYSIPVVYSGIIPDAFKEDNDAVVEGNIEEDGTFRAHTITVKCPSKYEVEE
ncbi:MAG: cytochrome c maturation protein CcmE [Dehalococcoidales bacterium]|nr:MAG: cytochrome c maturation protein CcmE [Dehalococcoidales bacterium]